MNDLRENQQDAPQSDVDDDSNRLWAALAYLVPFGAPTFLLVNRGTSRFARRHATNAINTQLTTAALILLGLGLSGLIRSPRDEGRELFADLVRVALWVYVLTAIAMAILASCGKFVESPLAVGFMDQRSSPKLRTAAGWTSMVRIVVAILLVVAVSPHIWTAFKDSYSPGISGENQTDDNGTLVLDPRAYGVELSDPVLDCPGTECWPQDALVREFRSVTDAYGPTVPAAGSRMIVVRLPYPNQIRRDGVVVVKRVEVVPEANDPTLCRWVAVAFQTRDSVEMEEGSIEVSLVESGVVQTEVRTNSDVSCQVPPTESGTVGISV